MMIFCTWKFGPGLEIMADLTFWFVGDCIVRSLIGYLKNGIIRSFSRTWKSCKAIGIFMVWFTTDQTVKIFSFLSESDADFLFLYFYFRLEHLQIANYGIGGHYEPHFDHARDDEDKFTDLGMGNRIATLLFYVSSGFLKAK